LRHYSTEDRTEGAAGAELGDGAEAEAAVAFVSPVVQAHVVAPCQHDKTCPMDAHSDTTW